MPEEYDRLKRRVPGLTRSIRRRFVENTGIWS